MAQPYSNGPNGYSYSYSAPSSAPATTSYEYRNQADVQSICDDILAGAQNLLHQLWSYLHAHFRSQQGFSSLLLQAGYQFRRNITRRRLLSFPHLLVVLWVFVLLWGERWIFATTVRSCDWDHWEDWVRPIPNTRLNRQKLRFTNVAPQSPKEQNPTDLYSLPTLK